MLQSASRLSARRPQASPPSHLRRCHTPTHQFHPIKDIPSLKSTHFIYTPRARHSRLGRPNIERRFSAARLAAGQLTICLATSLHTFFSAFAILLPLLEGLSACAEPPPSYTRPTRSATRCRSRKISCSPSRSTPPRLSQHRIRADSRPAPPHPYSALQKNTRQTVNIAFVREKAVNMRASKFLFHVAETVSHQQLARAQSPFPSARSPHLYSVPTAASANVNSLKATLLPCPDPRKPDILPCSPSLSAPSPNKNTTASKPSKKSTRRRTSSSGIRTT